MPPIATRPHQLRRTVFRGTHAVRNGWLTVEQLRSQAWQPLFRDVYADAELPVDHDLRIRGASLILPPTGVIAGRSAAHFHHAVNCQPDEPVEVLVARTDRRPSGAGLLIRNGTATWREVWRDRVPVTTPERSVWDLGRWYELDDAVAMIDALLANGRPRLRELPGIAASHYGQYRWRRAERAFQMASDLSESPQESRLRVRIVLSGLPRPVCQFTARDEAGEFVARLDLAWPDAKIGVEYDGLHHAGNAQFFADRRRLNKLVAAGWQIFHVTAATDIAAVVAQLRCAL